MNNLGEQSLLTRIIESIEIGHIGVGIQGLLIVGFIIYWATGIIKKL